jgi:hypothetical protein
LINLGSVLDSIQGHLSWFGSADAYRNTIAAKAADGDYSDFSDINAAMAFAPDLFVKAQPQASDYNTVATASPAPTGATIEKKSEYTSSGSPSEDNAPKSVSTIPSIGVAESQAGSNVYYLQTANSEVDPGKTVNGVTLVAGNLLDTVTSFLGWGTAWIVQWSKPLIYIGLILAISKVISIRKK